MAVNVNDVREQYLKDRGLYDLLMGTPLIPYIGPIHLIFLFIIIFIKAVLT